MALFMLLGQFAFFHLHLHLDRDNHQNSIGCEVFDEDNSIAHENGSFLEIESHFQCEVCDLYLSKKLDLPQSFSFSFIKADFETFSANVISLFSKSIQFTPLRAPPVKYA